MEFIRYYARLILQILSNIFTFIKEIIEAILNVIFFDITEYMKELFNVSKSFIWIDWGLLFLSFVFYILAFLIIIKYIKKRKTGHRFKRLSAIDSKYSTTNGLVCNDKPLSSQDEISLKRLVSRFSDFSAYNLGLYYEKRIVSAFFAGMATSKIIILEGISGTGKTSLPYAMGKFFRNDSRIIPVQPSWRDRSEMIGYLNEFTKTFNETDFLESIYETTFCNQKVNIIVLDEMNLARIEYYFADFLSILELPDPTEWNIHIVAEPQKGDPKNIVNGRLTIPQNVWFTGTANLDDSTFTITDKVYDRGIPIVINSKAVPFVAAESSGIDMNFQYLTELFNQAKIDYPVQEDTLKKLEILDQYMINHFKLTFGNRILKQAMDFIPVYVACGQSETEGLDYIFCRKILRKLDGLNLSFFQKEIKELIKLIQSTFESDQFSESIAYLESCVKRK